MDWSYILDILLKALGSTAATAITTLAGILFAKLSSKIKDSRVNNYIKQVVMAAEQLYPNQGTKRGTEKFEYVTKMVLDKFPKLNNSYIKSLIEGAVYALNNNLEKIKDTKIVDTNTDATKTNEEPKIKTDEKFIVQI